MLTNNAEALAKTVRRIINSLEATHTDLATLAGLDVADTFEIDAIGGEAIQVLVQGIRLLDTSVTVTINYPPE
jgi:hypothetical protein